MTALRFKGIQLTLADGVERVIPPLNFRSLQALQARIAGFKGQADPESMNLIVECLQQALVRNYPGTTVDQCVDMLDLENMLDVMQAVMDISGMKRKELEAAAAAANASPSIGPIATPN